MRKYHLLTSILIVAICMSCNPEPTEVLPWFKYNFYYTNDSNHDIQITTWNTDQKSGSVTERVYDIRQGETFFQRCSTSGLKINDDLSTDFDFVCIPFTDSLFVIFGSEAIIKIIKTNNVISRKYLYNLDNYVYSYEEPNMIYKYTFTEADFEDAIPIVNDK